MRSQTNPAETTGSPAARAKANPGRHYRVERGVHVRADRTGKLTYATIVTEGERNVWRSAPTLAAARKLRARLTTTLDEGGTVTRPKAVTLTEYAESWLDAQGGTVRASTLESYRSHWRTHLRDSLGSRKLSTVTASDVRRLVADLTDQGKAPATIRRVLQVLALMYADAVEQRLALANPVAGLSRRDRKAIRARKGHATFPELDGSQVAALVNATPKRHRLLVALAVTTGLRQGELLGLRWADLARDAHGEPILRVRSTLGRDGSLAEPKTAAAVRDVPIPASLAAALAAHRLSLPASRSTDEAFVFSTARGTPLHYRNVARRALDPATKAAGLPRLRWHDLRHVAASVLIADGHPVTYVSHVLGHATPSITLDTYSHLFARQATAAEHRAAAEARLAGVAL